MELAIRFDGGEAGPEQAALLTDHLGHWCREAAAAAPTVAAGSTAELQLALPADRLLEYLTRLQALCYDQGVQISFSCHALHEEET